jgi:hypothetical protein
MQLFKFSGVICPVKGETSARYILAFKKEAMLAAATKLTEGIIIISFFFKLIAKKAKRRADVPELQLKP